jgi:site-specific DNA recombinase
MRARCLPYGYRPIPGRPGEHVIHEPEASIGRQISKLYAGGDSSGQIAGKLNEEGVLPSRERAWNPSTINGSTKRPSGMLSNEVYGGRIVWNRVAKVKNPTTGKVPRIRGGAQQVIYFNRL